jgi:hypothetical protein
MNPCRYTHLSFDKGFKNIQWRKYSFFTKCYRGNCISACRTLILDPCLSPYAIFNSQWIKDLNIRSETLKLVQERAGNTVEAMAQARTSLVELSWHSN